MTKEAVLQKSESNDDLGNLNSEVRQKLWSRLESANNQEPISFKVTKVEDDNAAEDNIVPQNNEDLFVSTPEVILTRASSLNEGSPSYL